MLDIFWKNLIPSVTFTGSKRMRGITQMKADLDLIHTDNSPVDSPAPQAPLTASSSQGVRSPVYGLHQEPQGILLPPRLPHLHGHQHQL